MTQLPQDFADKLKQRIEHLCRTKFAQHDPDDLFQEVYLKFAMNRESKQTVEQAMIDVIRLTDGRKGMAHYEARRAFKNAVDYDELKAHEAPDLFGRINSSLDLEKAMSVLDERERFVIQEFFFNGTLGADIGRALKITESRAMQIKESALLKMRAKLENTQEVKETNATVKEMQELGYKSAIQISKELSLSYQSFNKNLAAGKIPYEVAIGANAQTCRYLSPETIKIISALVEKYGTGGFYAHLPFAPQPQRKMRERKRREVPPSFYERQAERAPQAQAAAPTDIKTRLLARAKALKEAGRFEASSEFYAFALELG